MTILFRCDGSKTIGMGHVVRCISLARYIKKHFNYEIFFAMRKSDIGISKVKKFFPVLKPIDKKFNYYQWMVKCIQDKNVGLLILDTRDNLSREILRKIKKNSDVKIVTIDDPQDKRLESDIAFYPPVPQLKKMNWDNYKGKLYVGLEYYILKEEFSKKIIKKNNKVPKILISMGGTDPENLTLKVLDLLSNNPGNYEIVILLGNGYSFITDLRNYLNKTNIKCKIIIDPKNVIDVFRTIDLGFISFGVTAYEFAALGIPALYLCRTKDHEISSQIFSKENMGYIIGNNDCIDLELFNNELQSFLSNKGKNRLLSNYRSNSKLKISNLKKITGIILED